MAKQKPAGTFLYKNDKEKRNSKFYFSIFALEKQEKSKELKIRYDKQTKKILFRVTSHSKEERGLRGIFRYLYPNNKIIVTHFFTECKLFREFLQFFSTFLYITGTPAGTFLLLLGILSKISVFH